MRMKTVGFKLFSRPKRCIHRENSGGQSTGNLSFSTLYDFQCVFHQQQGTTRAIAKEALILYTPSPPALILCSRETHSADIVVHRMRIAVRKRCKEKSEMQFIGLAAWIK